MDGEYYGERWLQCFRDRCHVMTMRRSLLAGGRAQTKNAKIRWSGILPVRFSTPDRCQPRVRLSFRDLTGSTGNKIRNLLYDSCQLLFTTRSRSSIYFLGVDYFLLLMRPSLYDVECPVSLVSTTTSFCPSETLMRMSPDSRSSSGTTFPPTSQHRINT